MDFSLDDEGLSFCILRFKYNAIHFKLEFGHCFSFLKY